MPIVYSGNHYRLLSAIEKKTESFSAEDVATKAHMTHRRTVDALRDFENKGVVTRLPKKFIGDEARWVFNRPVRQQETT